MQALTSINPFLPFYPTLRRTPQMMICLSTVWPGNCLANQNKRRSLLFYIISFIGGQHIDPTSCHSNRYDPQKQQPRHFMVQSDHLLRRLLERENKEFINFFSLNHDTGHELGSLTSRMLTWSSTSMTSPVDVHVRVLVFPHLELSIVRVPEVFQ